jgi:hypothetical protein
MRPVTRAMAQRRAPKESVRSYWLEECQLLNGDYGDESPPLYLTLPGDEGLDVKMLMEAGLLDATDIGGIALHHQRKVVAVESSPTAVLNLQETLPGLKIFEMQIQSLVRGPSPLRWPESADEVRACRALVTNLDFTASLGRADNGPLSFPVFATISKIAQLHAVAPTVQRWTLLLTLNAQVSWPAADWTAVLDLVRANLHEVADFRHAGVGMLGDEIVDCLEAGRYDDLQLGDEPLSRSLVQAFVPKRIADIGRAQGWRTMTRRNLSYEGTGLSAGMVSWVIRFETDPRAATDPQAVYRESVASVLANVERLA